MLQRLKHPLYEVLTGRMDWGGLSLRSVQCVVECTARSEDCEECGVQRAKCSVVCDVVQCVVLSAVRAVCKVQCSVWCAVCCV